MLQYWRSFEALERYAKNRSAQHLPEWAAFNRAVGSGGDVGIWHETYRVPLPAVVTVLEGGVEPRYPSVPGRMKAKKVAIEQRTAVTEPVGANRVRLLIPPPQPSDVQILGEGPAAAPAVVDLLERLGVLAR